MGGFRNSFNNLLYLPLSQHTFFNNYVRYPTENLMSFASGSTSVKEKMYEVLVESSLQSWALWLFWKRLGSLY